MCSLPKLMSRHRPNHACVDGFRVRVLIRPLDDSYMTSHYSALFLTLLTVQTCRLGQRQLLLRQWDRTYRQRKREPKDETLRTVRSAISTASLVKMKHRAVGDVGTLVPCCKVSGLQFTHFASPIFWLFATSSRYKMNACSYSPG